MSTDNKVKVSVYQQPKKGNYECGDSYFYIETDDEFVCAIADGLGSGQFAKESSQIVIDIIQSNIHASVRELVRVCNSQLQGKRGAVLGILKINFQAETTSFSSIGNIGIMTLTKDGKKKRNIPNAGYLAGSPREFKVVKENLEPDMMFIMFSDGVLDRELSQAFFKNKDVGCITTAYAETSPKEKMDDTTLIAIRYAP